MTYTEDNYGMDGKVSQSSIASDTNWQGLEELSGVDDHTNEYRHNPRLSLEDWTSSLKAVDRTFAPLNPHFEQNKANGTPAAQSSGFSVTSVELLVSAEMASAESGEDPSHVVRETPPLTLPVNLQSLHLNRSTLSPEIRLEWNNDIPEVNHLNSEHWRKRRTEKPTGWEEIHYPEGDISGNGMTELVFRSHRRLQPFSRHQREHPRDVEPEEDAFEDQWHLRVPSDRTNVHRVFSVSSGEQPVHSSHTERTLTEMQKDGTKEWVPNREGLSASSPLPCD